MQKIPSTKPQDVCAAIWSLVPGASLELGCWFLELDMQITVLAFAQTREQLGFGERTLVCKSTETPRAILRRIAPEFTPGPVRVAIDMEYADWDKPIGEARELALNPPVSGG